MIVGYARVSKEDQDLGRQIKALRDSGCDIVYEEKISGGKRSRPELDKMLLSLQRGDVVVVQKLDRLGRSLQHLLSVMEGFKESGIGFKSLSDSIDTSSSVGTMMFQMLAVVAEFERNLIRERTRDALAYRKSIGVRLGRPEKGGLELMDEFKRLADKGMKFDQVMATLGITKYKYYSLRAKMT